MHGGFILARSNKDAGESLGIGIRGERDRGERGSAILYYYFGTGGSVCLTTGEIMLCKVGSELASQHPICSYEFDDVAGFKTRG